VAAATALLLFLGWVSRSIFHIPVKTVSGASDEDTLPGGKTPSLPVDKNVQRAAALAFQQAWVDDPRAWEAPRPRMAAPTGRVLLTHFGLVSLLLALSCTPAQWQEAGTIWGDVLSGLEHGQTIEQIELKVAQDAGFNGVVNTVVVTIVVDTIDELIALGIIPPNLVPTATAMETQEAEKLVKMGGKLPHALRSIRTPVPLLAFTDAAPPLLLAR